MRSAMLTVAVSGAMMLVSASQAQTFSVVDQFSTDNPAAYQNWQTAATNAGAVSFDLEDFDSFSGAPGDIDIPPGTSLLTPSGLSIAYDESVDATSSADALIDISSTGWFGTPPFEGSPAFESFVVVPDNGNGDNKVVLNFPVPIIGFAADFDSPASGGDLILKIDGQTVVQMENEIPGGSDGFMGYVHNVPFSSIELDAENLGAAGEIVDIDNMRWAVAIPTPGALAGLLVAGVGLRRRRRRA